MGATRAYDFPRQADGYGQAGGDHASLRTDPDDDERLTGIYGTDGQQERPGRPPLAGHPVAVEAPSQGRYLRSVPPLCSGQTLDRELPRQETGTCREDGGSESTATCAVAFISGI